MPSRIIESISVFCALDESFMVPRRRTSEINLTKENIVLSRMMFSRGS